MGDDFMKEIKDAEYEEKKEVVTNKTRSYKKTDHEDAIVSAFITFVF